MGDAADWDFEIGEAAWMAHVSGICEDWCQYCFNEEERMKCIADLFEDIKNG